VRVCAQPWQDWGPDRRKVTIRIDDEQEQSPRPGNVRTGKKHKKKKGQKEAPPCQCCCRAPLATLVVFVVMLVIILAVVARSYALYAKELAAAGNSANGGRVGALLQEVGDSGGNSGEYASSGEQTVLFIEPFSIHECDPFTKTGSGQTQGGKALKNRPLSQVAGTCAKRRRSLPARVTARL
jgi:hypothetical protein